MALPSHPITLTPEQIQELITKLSHIRHDINNHLSLIVAAAELMKFKPETRERMAGTLSEQAPKIMSELQKFSVELEQALGVVRD
jgi:hypothetical protein